MKVGYIVFALLSLVWALVAPGAMPETEPPPAVLMIGAPCECLAGVPAEICDAELELDGLLAEREYRWIVLCLGPEAPLDEYRAVIGKIIRTQPQARTVIQSTDSKLQLLATAHQMEWGSCCEIIDMIQEDAE